MALYTLYLLAHVIRPQYGLAAILKAVNDGDFNFVESVKAYGVRAKQLKKLFLENGFKLVYDMDEDQPIADGFTLLLAILVFLVSS